jgi:hypothetical protein
MQTQMISATTATPAAHAPAHSGKPEGAGCGWFESSYELNQGLEVTELLDASLFQLWARAQSTGAAH